jgi:RNA polymerase sigma-70 factor (ECF subfamily)
MSEPNRARGRRAWQDERLVQRLLFDAVWAFVWKALARYGLADADRKDVAQEVVIAAWRGRASYRHDRGNPEQWLSRVVRNKVCDFLAARGKDRLVVGFDQLADMPNEDQPLEERMSMRDVADLVFAVLPEDERRAVIAIAVEGRSLREVAEAEGVSASTVHARYERGIEKLRAALEGNDERKAGLFLILFAGLFGPDGGSGPSREMLDEAWAHAVVELGLDRGPESEAPASGSRQRAPASAGEVPDPPSQHRPRGLSAKLLRLLGPLGGAVIGGVIVALLMRGCAPDPARAERLPAVVIAAPTAIIAGPEASAIAAVSTATAPTTTTSASARPPAPRYRDPFDPERALVDRVRIALVTGDVTSALALLAEHKQRFPEGQNAGTREVLWSQTCALARRIPAPSGAGEVDARCVGQP